MNKIYNYKIKNIFILIKTLYHSLIVLFVHTSWLSSGFKERFKKLNTINYAQKKSLMLYHTEEESQQNCQTMQQEKEFSYP